MEVKKFTEDDLAKLNEELKRKQQRESEKHELERQAEIKQIEKDRQNKLEWEQYVIKRCEMLNSEEGELLEGEPNCDICKNKRLVHGYSYHNGTIYENLVDCECQKKLYILKRIKNSGLSEQLENCKFDNFKRTQPHQIELYNKAQKYIAEGSKQWFVVLGQTGAGKTHICTALCGHLIESGKNVRYLRWAVELKRLKMSAGNEDYANEFNRIFKADVIYIDDFLKRGAGFKPSDADIKLAFELIDTAIAENKTLILSGEDVVPSLMDVDEAIAGRIIQNAGNYLTQISKDRNKNYRI